MTNERIRGRDGFSLVEVLVALAVAGLVISGGGGLVAMVQGLERRASAEREARDMVIAADRLLRAIVEGAVPDVSRDPAEIEAWSADRATLLTNGPPVLTFDRPRLMTLAIDKVHDGARLSVRWRDPETSAEREEEIVAGARSLALFYFDAERPGGASSWRGGWGSPSRLPAGVRLRIDIAELGPPIELIYRTYSRMPGACVLLPHEPRCSGGEPRIEAAQ